MKCGTQYPEGSKFCKFCGAATVRQIITPTETVSSTQYQPVQQLMAYQQQNNQLEQRQQQAQPPLPPTHTVNSEPAQINIQPNETLKKETTSTRDVYIDYNDLSDQCETIREDEGMEAAVDFINKYAQGNQDTYLLYTLRANTYLSAIGDQLEGDELDSRAKQTLTAIINDCSRAIVLMPDVAIAYALRGSAYSYLEEFVKSIPDLNMSIRIFESVMDLDELSECKFAYNMSVADRGFSFEEVGRYQEAISDFEKYLELCYDGPIPNNVRSRLKRLTGNAPERSVSDELLELYEIARTSMANGSFLKALNTYNAIASEDEYDWEAAYYSISLTAMRYLKDDNNDAAIDTLRENISDVLSLIQNNIYSESAQEEATSMVFEDFTIALKLIHERVEKEFSDFRSKLLEIREWDEEVTKLSKENYQIRGSSNARIASSYVTIGNGILEIFSSNSEIGQKGISAVSKACDILDGYTGEYLNWSYRSRYKKEYREDMASVIEQTTRRRIEEYWIVHRTVKEALEAEKMSLFGQIATLNNEIHLIPGYSEWTSMGEEIEALKVEKNATGLFKFSEKKPIKAKINEVALKRQQKYSEIWPAIEAVQRRIAPLQGRIAWIDAEFAKPR